MTIISVNMVIAADEVLPVLPLTACAITNNDIRAVNDTGFKLPSYPADNHDLSVLTTALESKRKANGEFESVVTKFNSVSTKDRYIFEGKFRSLDDSLVIAVLSDDGVEVTIDDTLVKFNNFDRGQALPNLNNSLKVIEGAWKINDLNPHTIKIRYSNICYTGKDDIDGLTVFFCGGVNIIPPDAKEPIPVNTSLSFTENIDKYPYTGNVRTVKTTVGLVVNGSGIDQIWGTKSWVVNVVNTADPTTPLASRTFIYEKDKLSYSDNNVDIVLPKEDGEYILKAIVKDINLESVLNIDIYKIIVENKPDIVAGGKDDINHKGFITMKAISGTKCISGVNIKLNVSNEGTNIDDKYKPNLTDNLKITDGNGEAYFELTSGQLVSNEQSVLKFGFIPESDGVIFDKFNVNISDENINIYLIDILTGENKNIIYTDGDVILLKSNSLFSNNKNVTNHKIDWKFTFYTFDDNGNKTILYSGDNNKSSLQYGTIISPDENISDVDGNSFALFITGSEMGWLSWECIDNDVFIDNSTN